MEIKWDAQTKKHMELKENQGVTYLSYPDFETPRLFHQTGRGEPRNLCLYEFKLSEGG